MEFDFNKYLKNNPLLKETSGYGNYTQPEKMLEDDDPAAYGKWDDDYSDDAKTKKYKTRKSMNEYDQLLGAIETLLNQGETEANILVVVKDTLGMREEVSVSSSGVEMEEGIEDDPQFEDDMSKMINHIVRGYGYIDPEYVQQTWEMASDIPFGEVQDKVFAELVRAGLTNYDDIDEVEEMKEGDYEYKSAEEFDMEPQEGPNDPLGPNASKYPRADFADAVYAANQAGISKDELIRLINQNAR